MDYRSGSEFWEMMEFLEAYDTGQVLEYQGQRIGDKYAIVLTGMPAAELVGWSNNADNALKIAQALNQAEGL
jgi:hypothetical protein